MAWLATECHRKACNWSRLHSAHYLWTWGMKCWWSHSFWDLTVLYILTGMVGLLLEWCWRFPCREKNNSLRSSQKHILPVPVTICIILFLWWPPNFSIYPQNKTKTLCSAWSLTREKLVSSSNMCIGGLTSKFLCIFSIFFQTIYQFRPNAFSCFRAAPNCKQTKLKRKEKKVSAEHVTRTTGISAHCQIGMNGWEDVLSVT